MSRTELLAWLDSFFQLNISKVEQCANGAVYCQVIDACHPNAVSMRKVNWAAREPHQSLLNYKVLQQAFDRCGITRHIEVDKLIRGKYQDNLEMLQWSKTYFDRTFPGGDYDAIGRRGDAAKSRELPDWASRPCSGQRPSFVAQGSEARAKDRQVSPGMPGRVPRSPENSSGTLQEHYDRLREEVVDLKITVDGLETERDFYFQKLRDIEILCQALESRPNAHVSVGKFVEDVKHILYAKDDEDDLHEFGATNDTF